MAPGGLRFFTLKPNLFSEVLVKTIICDVAPAILHGRDWSAAILDSPRQVRPVGEGDMSVVFFDVRWGVNIWSPLDKEEEQRIRIPDWAMKLSTGPCIALDLRQKNGYGLREEILRPTEVVKLIARQIIIKYMGKRRNGDKPSASQPVAVERIGRREKADMKIRVNRQQIPPHAWVQPRIG